LHQIDKRKDMKRTEFSKNETQKFIHRFLSKEDLRGISQNITTAYSAVDEIYKSTPALGAFLVGADIRPHLLRIVAEHLLQQFADNSGFTHEVRKNVAKNCNHLRIHKNGLALTSHYMGANCERREARKALHKRNLSERNFDLFEFEDNETEFFLDIGYAQIMHGGVISPTNIIINIPTRDQRHTLGSMSLMVVNENKALVEEILDEPPYKLKEALNEIKNGTKAQETS